MSGDGRAVLLRRSEDRPRTCWYDDAFCRDAEPNVIEVEVHDYVAPEPWQRLNLLLVHSDRSYCGMTLWPGHPPGCRLAMYVPERAAWQIVASFVEVTADRITKLNTAVMPAHVELRVTKRRASEAEVKRGGWRDGR